MSPDAPAQAQNILIFRAHESDERAEDFLPFPRASLLFLPYLRF
jgi:hypothetical protein